MMSSAALPRTLGFIRSDQNQDGGWGYRPGGASWVEPSAFCAMALLAGGDRPAAGRGLAFLKACQNASGGTGVSPKDQGGSWMAYAALLAYHALGADAEATRLVGWILGLEDASRRFAPEDVRSIAKTYRYDASIPGWPWTPGTTAWVEPTALFILALTRAGVASTEPRIQAGVRLLIDRRVPSGGWNFGNPFSKSHELEATLLSTSLALAALAAAGTPASKAAAEAGLPFIEAQLAGDASVVSLSWTLIALRSLPAGDRLVPAVSARLAGLARTDGSFRGNLFESALAFLALEDASRIIRVPGKGP
jgi:hypothetical protein